MKVISAALLAFLQTTNAYNKADVISIALTNGAVFNVTTAQQDLTVAGTKYFSSANGAWQRGKVTSELSKQPKANSMSLTAFIPLTVLFPGTTTPVMEVILAGLFDAAVVTALTVYWGIGETPAVGIARGSIILNVGEITKMSGTGRSQVKFDVSDATYRLNTQVPKNLLGTSCRHTLFDANCSLLKSNFVMVNTLASGSTSLTLNLATSLSSAAFYNSFMTFTQGQVMFTTGKNAGIGAYIKSQNSLTQLLLNAPLPFPIAVGDAFDVYPGCNLSVVACNSQFNNLINIGSTPFIPDPSVAV